MYKLAIQHLNSSTKVNLFPSDRWTVESIDGLDPVEKTIYTQKLYGIEGEYVTGSYIPSRQIIITMAILPPIEDNRRFLFNQYSAGQEVILSYWRDFKSDDIDITGSPQAVRKWGVRKINGVVQRIEINQYNNPQIAQISINCSSPLFKGYTTDHHVTTSTRPVIFNEGDVETGLTMVMSVTQDITDPVEIELERHNRGLIEPYKKMSFEGLDLYRGDAIILSTVSGQMRASLYRSWAPYTSINIFGYVKGDMLRIPGRTTSMRDNHQYLTLKITAGIMADVTITNMYAGV